MTLMHPNDRELQQYLNNRLPELKYYRTKRHLQQCAACRGRLGAFLDIELELDKLPLEAPPPDLADRIMNQVKGDTRGHAAHLRASAAASNTHSPEVSENCLVQIWRSFAGCRDLIHGLVAMAATYLFISSGLINKIALLDGGRLGSDVRNGAFQLFQAMETVSRQLLS